MIRVIGKRYYLSMNARPSKLNFICQKESLDNLISITGINILPVNKNACNVYNVQRTK